MAKVFVVTDAEPLKAERYIGVFGSEKSAERYIRGMYPNARKDEGADGSYASFECHRGSHIFLMFIHREEVSQ